MELTEKDICEEIARQTYQEAESRTQASQVREEHSSLLPTKSTESRIPEARFFLNNDVLEAKAQMLQGLLNKLPSST